MNSLKKVVFASFVTFGIVCLFQSYTEAASRYSGLAWVEAPVSSGNITGYTKGCAVRAVYASSNTATSAITNWFVIIASNASENIVGLGSFASADYRSPAMYFPVVSSNTTVSYSGIYKVLDYGEEGISFSSAPYIFKNGATSGQAQRVWLQIIP